MNPKKRQTPMMMQPPPDFMGSYEDIDELLYPENIGRFEEEEIECPFLPLRDVVLFPQMMMTLFIGRERSLAALDAAMRNKENLIVATQKDGDIINPTIGDIYTIGTEMSIGRSLRMPDDSSSVLAQGRRRIEIIEFVQWNPYIRVRARTIPEPEIWDENGEALMRVVLTLFEKIVESQPHFPEEAQTLAQNIDEPSWLADFMASTLNLTVADRQGLLELLDPVERLQRIGVLLGKELEVLELEDRIHSQVRQEVDKAQREHFLREQMRVIQGELGETDLFAQELHELQEAFAQKELPPDVRAKAEKEMARLMAMPPMSPEVGIIRTYLDWLMHLPWLEKSVDNLNVAHAAKVLDGDHFGLEKVKERILDYIAVKQIAQDKMRSPILCFVGPPGTGKTSIGRSIANALGREFVRISLGGVRDEAEIRGHRRTYVGAMPGRIVQGMRRVGTRNPLFMLDEVDKLTRDFHGDPAAALLEVLDPEQNGAFGDHYLDLDYDLSEVMFVTTANQLDPIPAALRDRMEVIEFSSYLEEEKLGIARQFMLPKQVEAHGIGGRGISFTTDALAELVRHYTREAGVRNLEREMATMCRKIARMVVEERPFPKRITPKRITDLLGPPRYVGETLNEQDEVGIATALAWTPTGGEILLIEINLMPGKGNLLLTGQLGDVMRESAQAALTFARSQSEALRLDASLFEKLDIHIHIPEGAVPKDGPSAGVALATALVSALTKRPIRRTVAMTGEITLRGRVLPVGGIREKVLAAYRTGVRTIILPKKNEPDLETVPDSIRAELSFTPASKMNQVLQVALLPRVGPPKRPTRRPATYSGQPPISN